MIYFEFIRNDRFWIYILYFAFIYLWNISWTRALAFSFLMFGYMRRTLLEYKFIINIIFIFDILIECICVLLLYRLNKKLFDVLKDFFPFVWQHCIDLFSICIF